MDCRTVKDWIDDYLDGMLDDTAQGELQAHLATCPKCRDRLAREQALRDALKSLPVPAPDPVFADRAFERAAAAHRRRPRIHTAILKRLAASIIVVFAVGFLFKDAWRPDRTELPVAFVRSNQPEEVRLVFRSGQALERVTLRLAPQEGVELVGFENQREIVWQTNLVQGENLLVLPVIVRDQEGGTLIAEIRHGSQRKQFDLRIEVRPPEGSRREGAGMDGRRLTIMT